MPDADTDERQVTRRQLLGIAGLLSASSVVTLAVAVRRRNGYGSGAYGERQYGS